MLLRGLLLSVLFFGCTSFKRNLYTNQDKYKLAYNYIIKDQRTSNKNINVADSIVNISMSPFFKELSKERGQTEQVTRLFLDSVDQKLYLPVSNTDIINMYFERYANSTTVVYFSRIYEGLLVAELLDGVSPLKTYKENTLFNSGIRYLFMFDSITGKIKKVHKIIVQYN